VERFWMILRSSSDSKMSEYIKLEILDWSSDVLKTENSAKTVNKYTENNLKINLFCTI
jgi:hypothetical protein